MTAKAFEDLLSFNYRWPQKGDRLVRPIAGLDRTVADLHTSPSHTGVFSTGYRQAADAIVEAVERGEILANFVCWPALLLYRHALELAFKESIRWSASALEEDIGLGKSEHRLSVLLARLSDQSERLFPDEDQEAFKAFILVVKEFDRIDPTGQAFRYPSDTNGKPFKLGVSHIDLRHVKQAMEKVLNFLDGYAGAASNLAEIAADMRADGNADMYADSGW